MGAIRVGAMAAGLLMSCPLGGECGDRGGE